MTTFLPHFDTAPRNDNYTVDCFELKRERYGVGFLGRGLAVTVPGEYVKPFMAFVCGDTVAFYLDGKHVTDTNNDESCIALTLMQLCWK